MKCCLCKNEIEKQYTPEGKCFWDQGNNAQPLSDGRCCDSCNMKVIEARLISLRNRQ